MLDEVVCFKTLGGAQIVGKLSETPTHRSFVKGEPVVYLDDALFIGVGQQGLGMAPITDIGEGQDEKKFHIPFALYRSAIMGQIPLDEEISRMYREKTSGIVLIR